MKDIVYYQDKQIIYLNFFNNEWLNGLNTLEHFLDAIMYV